MNLELKKKVLYEVLDYRWIKKMDLMVMLDAMNIEYPHNASKDVFKAIIKERGNLDKLYSVLESTKVKRKTLSSILGILDNVYFEIMEKRLGIEGKELDSGYKGFKSIFYELKDVEKIVQFFNENDFSDKKIYKIRITDDTKDGIIKQIERMGLNDDVIKWTIWTQELGDQKTFPVADVIHLD